LGPRTDVDDASFGFASLFLLGAVLIENDRFERAPPAMCAARTPGLHHGARHIRRQNDPSLKVTRQSVHKLQHRFFPPPPPSYVAGSAQTLSHHAAETAIARRDQGQGLVALAGNSAASWRGTSDRSVRVLTTLGRAPKAQVPPLWLPSCAMRTIARFGYGDHKGSARLEGNLWAKETFMEHPLN